MVIYAPGTDETDPKKQNMALQQSAAAIATAQDDLETHASDIATLQSDVDAAEADIATNTAAIATNTTDIAALETALANLIVAGTVMLFVQTNAPTGWTKITTHNDKALRIVSGTASSGGTNAFSTVFAQTATAGHTLTTGEIPSHSHSFTYEAIEGGSTIGAGTELVNTPTGGTTGTTGGGGSHSHGITMSIQYVDVIAASKDA